MAIRITYNGVNIDLQIDEESLVTKHIQERNQNRSASGKIETINVYGIQEMSFSAIFSEAVYQTLWGWWSWARQGKVWSFAMDTNAMANTTLDDAAAAGQKNIPLTATTGFEAADVCLIKAIDADDEFEIVVIASVDSGVKVVATSNLVFTYAASDIFRHLDYWPSVISLDEDFNPLRDNNIYRKTFKFVEVL